MRHRTALPALALGFLLAAAAWGQHHQLPKGFKPDYDPEPRGGDPNPPANCAGISAKIAITAASISFTPSTMTVNAGEPVCWTWTGTGVSHNIKADDGSFTSGNPDDHGTFQYTFTTPGTFGYYCQVHGTTSGGMRGTVTVRAAPGDGGGDGPGTLQLAPTAYTVDEAAGVLTVTVERNGGSDGAAAVKFATANGSAKAGKDFLPRAGVLKWVSGDGDAKTFEVPIKKDSAQEADETFAVKLSKPTGATLGASSAVITIHEEAPGCNGGLTAPSRLRAGGQSTGEIRLAWTDDSGLASAFRIERREPGGGFQEIAALAAGADSFVDSGLPGGATFEYRVRAVAADGSSAVSRIVAGATDGLATPCDESRNALCLNGGRFEATVQRHGADTAVDRGIQRVMLPEAPNSGLFALSAEGDLQVLLTVHDGCGVNDHYWVNLAAVTDVELTFRVRDTQTGRTWVYFNPAGSAPAPVRDVEAFGTCP